MPSQQLKLNDLLLQGRWGKRRWRVVMKCCLMSSDVSWHIRDKLWPVLKHGSINLYIHGNQKARQDRQPAQDIHLDSHTAPELWGGGPSMQVLVLQIIRAIILPPNEKRGWQTKNMHGPEHARCTQLHIRKSKQCIVQLHSNRFTHLIRIKTW